jgi:hypothetical protein
MTRQFSMVSQGMKELFAMSSTATSEMPACVPNAMVAEFGEKSSSSPSRLANGRRLEAFSGPMTARSVGRGPGAAIEGVEEGWGVFSGREVSEGRTSIVAEAGPGTSAGAGEGWEAAVGAQAASTAPMSNIAGDLIRAIGLAPISFRLGDV